VSIIIATIFQVYSVIIIVKVVLSYFLSPYNNIRRIVDRLVDPLLVPIQRIIPPIANLDFSPIILLLLLQLVERLVLTLVR
jgi:uncharacterized protein YggT (Ycf19 family)